MTVKTRITLFIVGAGLVASLLFSIVVFYELIEQPFDLLDTVLKEEASRAILIVVEKQRESGSAAFDFASPSMDGYWIEIYEPAAQRMLFRSEMAKRVSLSAVKPGSGATVSVAIPPGQINPEQDKNLRMTFRIRTFLLEHAGRLFTVQIARPMEKLEHEIQELVFGIVAGLIFSTLVLIVISRLMAGKILKPIGQMRDLAQDISEKNLDKRIPVGNGRDEFSELARTINRMLNRLQYSFARQRDFLFDASHELKTPLTAIRLAVDEISAAEEGQIPPSVRDNLLRLNSQALRMEKLVKDLLNLSSLEALRGIEPKPVQISEMLSSLAQEYKFMADNRNIAMDIRLSEGLAIDGDEERLRRAFSNILDNAVKYNVEGGRIELTGEQSADALTVRIANAGPGVAEDEISRVFDQFYRAEKSRSLQHGGSGLGLTMVKRIVELHGGTVKLESQQGRWTIVTVSLPRRPYANSA